MTVRFSAMRPGRLALLPVLAVLATFAAQPAAAQGTSEQRDACESDAISLCGEFIPNVAAIEACMKRKIKSLSPACRVVMSGSSRKQKRSAAATSE
jgi:hypothetical protein